MAQAGLSGGQRHDRASGGSGHQPSHEKARHALVPPECHRGGGLAHRSTQRRLDSTSAVASFSLRQPWVLGRNSNDVVLSVAVQHDASFLCLALEARRIGDAYRKGSVPNATRLRNRGLANLGTIMIENHDGGWLSGK